jgi:hypothetical protein
VPQRPVSAPGWRRQKRGEDRSQVWVGHHVLRHDLAAGKATVKKTAGRRHGPVEEGNPVYLNRATTASPSATMSTISKIYSPIAACRALAKAFWPTRSPS